MELAEVTLVDNAIEVTEPIWDFLFHELPQDPICHILAYATFHELCTCSLVSRKWYKLIIPNNWLWLNLCQSYWKTKTYIPSQYRNLIRSSDSTQSAMDKDTASEHATIIAHWIRTHQLDAPNQFELSSIIVLYLGTLPTECIARSAFRLAYMDRLRTTLTVDELVGIKWYFRFKEQAGETWLAMDPFWNLNDAEFVENNGYRRNGDSDRSSSDQDSDADDHGSADDEDEELKYEELLQYQPSELVGILTDDEIEEYKLKKLKYDQMQRQNSLQDLLNKPVLSEHEQRLLRCTRIKFKTDGRMKFMQNRIMSDLVTASQGFRWRFAGQFYHGRMFGNAVAVNSYPKKHISRHPVHWGWVMQSVWVIYTSFPMPEPDSADDKLICEDDFSISGYAEMIQYNYMGGVRQPPEFNVAHNEESLMNERGEFNLEYLKQLERDTTAHKDGDETVAAHDIEQDLQHALAQFFMQQQDNDGLDDADLSD
mmetsp:Transcript_44418/g.71143  ORF Transcript_44418/g.71143 Transcript_44418/m.71143 type:complete len:482 (-) Transcript_44418:89-1534(-)